MSDSRLFYGQASADIGTCPQCHRDGVVITEIGRCWKCSMATGNRMTSPWFKPDDVVSTPHIDRIRELEGQ